MVKKRKKKKEKKTEEEERETAAVACDFRVNVLGIRVGFRPIKFYASGFQGWVLKFSDLGHRLGLFTRGQSIPFGVL
jgi:hypothetical protein